MYSERQAGHRVGYHKEKIVKIRVKHDKMTRTQYAQFFILEKNKHHQAAVLEMVPPEL